mmetsp:Transcript_40224/g.85800  ORF Transcript_40224/g.85800 Transcript_40224/m.85800 type:complete len:210 (-) Transcript_40224:32-661(-)
MGRAVPLLLAVVAATGASGAGISSGGRLLRRSTAVASGRIPLELSGATCADPPPELPKYCCNGILPNSDYADTCECNPGWTHKECVCKGYLTTMPCHECMVHLPATNRWMKSFKKSELYDNCASCVVRCKAELEQGQCAQFMTDVWTSKFPDADPAQVLCTNDYLKSQLMRSDYPIDMKRVLYKAPRLRADDDYHQPVDWPVEGVGATG